MYPLKMMMMILLSGVGIAASSADRLYLHKKEFTIE
jgi:hypothetical protein